MTTQYGNYTLQSRATRWQDWATLILAVWLFISPWLLQFGAAVQVPPAGAAPGATVAVSHAAWNAWVLGVIVFLVALSAIGSIEVWQEYWNLVRSPHWLRAGFVFAGAKPAAMRAELRQIRLRQRAQYPVSDRRAG